MPGQAVPEVKAAIANVVNLNTGSEVTPKEADKIADKAMAAIKNDPVLANATGQERWWQSGVGAFSHGGILWCLGAIATQVWTNGCCSAAQLAKYDIELMMFALGGIVAFGGVLYRRFVPGLKPLFWRWGKS